MRPFLNRLAESASSTWRLLSDTTNFLSRMKLLEDYDQELRKWREQLLRKRADPQAVKDVRDERGYRQRLLAAGFRDHCATLCVVFH